MGKKNDRDKKHLINTTDQAKLCLTTWLDKLVEKGIIRLKKPFYISDIQMSASSSSVFCIFKLMGYEGVHFIVHKNGRVVIEFGGYVN